MSLYHLGGDILTNLTAGAVAGGLCAAAFGPAWEMLPAMVAGMLLGMAVATPIAVIAGIWFGAFEVMLPTMVTGMLSGMAVAMAAVEFAIDAQAGVLYGCISGLLALAFTYLMNAMLRGEVRLDR